jgi:hypothetical protein
MTAESDSGSDPEVCIPSQQAPVVLSLEGMILNDSLSPTRGQKIVQMSEHLNYDLIGLVTQLWELCGGALARSPNHLIDIFKQVPNSALAGSQIHKLFTHDPRLTDLDIFITGTDEEAKVAFNVWMAMFAETGRDVLCVKDNAVVHVMIQDSPVTIQIVRLKSGLSFTDLLRADDNALTQAYISGEEIVCSIDFLEFLRTREVKWWTFRSDKNVERALRYRSRDYTFSPALSRELDEWRRMMPALPTHRSIVASPDDFADPKLYHFRDLSKEWLAGLELTTFHGYSATHSATRGAACGGGGRGGTTRVSPFFRYMLVTC